MLVRVADIRIAEEMKATPPKQQRMDNKKAYYNTHGHFENPIGLSKGFVLIDGYASYLIAQEWGIDIVECEFKPDKPIEEHINCGWNKKRGNRKFNAYQRKMIYENGHGICAICGKPVALEDFTIDHWEPLAKGGTNKLDNLKVAHRSCNLIKGSFQPEMLMGELADIVTYQSRQNEEIARTVMHTGIKLVISMAVQKMRSFVF